MILEFRRIEVAGLLFDDVLGKIQHVLCDLHILNLIEIFRLIAHLIGVAQQHAHQALVARFERDHMLAAGEHHAGQRHLVE